MQLNQVNTRLGLETSQWSLTFDGRNITDERYHLWDHHPDPATG